MSPAVKSEWLTASEAALYLKVRTRTVLLWVRQGKLKGYALSGAKRHVWRFRAADLDGMMTCRPLLSETGGFNESKGKTGQYCSG
jgi:excisionase family DNA binding protein